MVVQQEEQPYLAYGTAGRAHGLAGELFIQPYNGESTLLNQLPVLWFGPQPLLAVPHKIETSRPYKKGWLVRLQDLDRRVAVERLAGMQVWVERSQLPDTAQSGWLLGDLVDAEVTQIQQDDSERHIGYLRRFTDGPQTILEIDRGNRMILIPWVEAFVVGVRERDSIARIVLHDRAPVDL